MPALCVWCVLPTGHGVNVSQQWVRLCTQCRGGGAPPHPIIQAGSGAHYWSIAGRPVWSGGGVDTRGRSTPVTRHSHTGITSILTYLSIPGIMMAHLEYTVSIHPRPPPCSNINNIRRAPFFRHKHLGAPIVQCFQVFPQTALCFIGLCES